eukprot:scaffold176013_cov36-Tisochrysis_lutea.AAC.1
MALVASETVRPSAEERERRRPPAKAPAPPSWRLARSWLHVGSSRKKRCEEEAGESCWRSI